MASTHRRNQDKRDKYQWTQHRKKMLKSIEPNGNWNNKKPAEIIIFQTVIT